MSGPSSNGVFSYDGRLVFNGLYRTKVLNASINIEDIVENELKDFSKGTKDKPGSGYHMLSFSEMVAESPEISRPIKEQAEDMHGIRYRYENWDEGEVEDDEEGTVYRHIRTTDSVDVYWHFPDYLFIKGNKTEAKKAANLIDNKLDEYLKTEEIGFSPDFLLWILSKYKNGEALSDELSTNLLSDARIEGDEDRFGRSNRVDDSTDIAKATTILMGILRGKEMAFVEGIFGVSGQFVKAQIETGGRVHIKAEQDIDGGDPLKRMALSVTFLTELLKVYDHWESLDSGEKYPPDEFFYDLYDECERQGAEITFPADEVVEKYRQKGNRKEYKNRQSGLAEF
ncbi:hypothetical protein [Halomarina oriensis]|uniref:Uncharacterized protein n=1 Tax=Halomarina oriensis TaxID=671145 RepID=A0A6B0GMA6_9EURY|nr:hypothetical protein [Halomarina oriensis]MWG34619.1 hypothetical protein [Halomarina oriensis]